MSDWAGTGTTITESATRYATVAEFKAWIGIPVADTTDDALINEVLDESSRQIDDDLGRKLYQSAVGVVRYYTAKSDSRLLIDDLVTLTELATDGNSDRTYATVWAASDYDLEPFNAATDSMPYELIAVAPIGRYAFPVGLAKGIRITGTWGWPEIPIVVRRKCVLKAAWIFKRKDSPVGVMGSADMGLVRVARWDSDYEKFAQVHRRAVVS